MKRQQRHGIILLDKPLHLSSTQALENIKRILNCKKGGHTGALDPLATGLLPLCLGDATKFAQYLLAADKTYETTIKLGVTTTTGDAEGEVLSELPVNVSLADIEAILPRFRGDIKQIPPMHSALKHNGQPLYALARQGIEIERAARPVTIHELTLLDFDGENLTLRASVSKGTYIRSLAIDIGEALATGGHVSMLRRTAVGPFGKTQMQTLEEWSTFSPEEQEQHILPMDCFMPSWPQRQLDRALLVRFGQGQRIRLTPAKPGWWRFYSKGGSFVGVGHLDEQGCLHQRRVISYFPEVLGENRS